MKDVIMIGVDLAKNVFQAHGVDADPKRKSRAGQAQVWHALEDA